MRTLRTVLLVLGAVLLGFLVYSLGADSIISALTRVTWWQFALICLVHTLNVAADSYGWRYTIAREKVPVHRLMAARCAGDAVSVLSGIAAVSGEATKAWLLRREIPYRESVPSLIVAKTAEVLGQALLLAFAIGLAFATDVVSPTLRTAMLSLLLVEVIGVGGFLGVQIAGVVGGVGRVLSRVGVNGIDHTDRLDEALRGFYRHEWRRFLKSVGMHFIGWMLGAVQALLILQSLGVSASMVAATIIEALWSAVRFATFFIPASLGTLEGANAAAFRAFGFGASAGLAFTLIRRAAQAVWIGIGVVILLAMRPAPAVAAPLPAPAD